MSGSLFPLRQAPSKRRAHGRTSLPGVWEGIPPCIRLPGSSGTRAIRAAPPPHGGGGGLV